jgi:molybdate transport system substrate-binding protein
MAISNDVTNRLVFQSGGGLLRNFKHRVALGAAPLLLISGLFATSSASAATSPRAVLRGNINVSAASSLTAAFTEIGAKFHRTYPHATVTFNFGSSTTLAAQILSGAPVDVFASADLTDMDTVVTAGDIRVAPKIFTRNTMEIAVKPGNPGNITGLASLSGAGVISLCAASAPCGIYAANILRRSGVVIPTSSITRAPNSTSTVEQVSVGDAAAAIVYVTDVHGQGALVSGVRIPASKNTVADYPIARLTSSTNAKVAQAFVNFVQSHAGQRSLLAQGFLAP